MLQFLQKLFLPPIVLYQMGKVGSSSLRDTLLEYYDGFVVHAHTEQMMTERQRTFLRWRKRLGLPIYIICPVREPISRNISAFFENFQRDTGRRIDEREWTVDELSAMFLKHYPHNVCLDWFDEHLRTTFGVDVFSETFPFERKWKLYRHKSARVLVYRSDLDRSEQLEVISAFVGRKIPKWIYSNVSSDKDYSELYKMFAGSIKMPEIYISIMYGSRFCRHFWMSDEIAEFAERWKE